MTLVGFRILCRLNEDLHAFSRQFRNLILKIFHYLNIHFWRISAFYSHIEIFNWSTVFQFLFNYSENIFFKITKFFPKLCLERFLYCNKI